MLMYCLVLYCLVNRQVVIQIHPAIDTRDATVKDVKNECFQVSVDK